MLFADDITKKSMREAIKIVESNTCTKFKESEFTPCNMTVKTQFAVVFGNVGNRYET